MKLATLLLSVFLFAGCASIQVSDSFTTKLAVQQGTLRVIQDDPARALRVQEILTEVRPYVEEEVITLAILEDQVNAQIRWERLSVADAQLLTMVLDELWTQLAARYELGLLTPETRTSVTLVMEWIEDSASLVILMKGDKK